MTHTVHHNRLDQGGKSSLDHLEGLLANRIQRNNFHRYHLPEAPRSVEGKRLDALLDGVQQAIHHRVDGMPELLVVRSPAVSWSDENIELQSFYKGLRNAPEAGLAFKLCEAFRIDADRSIHAILSDSGSSPDEVEAKQMNVISKTRELIGQVVFVADRGLDTLQKFNPGIILDKLENTAAFVKCFVKAELQFDEGRILLEKNKAANAFALQDQDMVLYTEEPKVVAKLLLTPRGQLNLGMIGAIKEQFFPNTSNLLEYQRGILFVLGSMDDSWQKAMDAVQVPSDQNIASRAIVRADLGLLPTEEITKLHCQQVVLGGLLSQLCQGPVGDCFAVSWAIKKHEAFLLGSVADYAALLKDGYLTRMVNGKPDQFFFETAIADGALNSLITLSSDGTISEHNNAPFWECPNLVAACRQMGIVDLKEQKDALLERIFGQGKAPNMLTWDELIQACAKDEEMLISGRYGFSLCNNRLLRAWETSLAGMAEARPGDYVRGNITDAVLKVFDGVFVSRKNLGPTPKNTLSEGTKKAHKGTQSEEIEKVYHGTQVDEIKKVFQNTLNDSFRLVYNGAIPLNKVADDGSSSSGGFELYQRDVKDLTGKGVRIATPEEFREFILGVIDKTEATLKKASSTKDRAVAASVLQAMNLCASSPSFMKNVLYAYDEQNKREPDPVTNYKKLERTPMTSLDGDNPWEVMAIDTGKDFTPDVRTVRPKDPGDLLKWLLGIASWKESTQHYLEDAIPNEENPGTSPQHAFNIEIEGPEFKSFLGSKLSADAWIKKTIIDPGMKIAKAEMDSGAKLLYAQQVSGWLSQQFQSGVPPTLKQQMDDLFTVLNKKVLTVQQFAGRANDGLESIFHLDADQKRQMSIVFDGMLLQALPKDPLNALQQQAVRFAKTNWDEGPKNIYFCCFFNPRTKLLDFGSIAEDKTNLQPMDQVEWVDNQQWEIDPVLIK